MHVHYCELAERISHYEAYGQRKLDGFDNPRQSPAARYCGTITVSSTNATNTPRNISVTPTVSAPSGGGNPSGAPSISSLSPIDAVAGGTGFTLTVTGGNFVSGSVVEWNGAALPTTFVIRTSLQAAVPASDIASPGLAEVQVITPLPGGGSSAAMTFPIYIGLQTNDLIYDPVGGKIYASIPSTSPIGGNSILPIDPVSGTLGALVFLGSEPGKLAISNDSQYIYAALNGAAAVQQFILGTQMAGLQFSLGSDNFFGPYYVEDMAVLPGAPTSVGVSRMNPGYSPANAGVAIFDSGVQRANATSRGQNLDSVAFSASSSTLYAYDNENSSYDFYTLAANSSGVSISQTTGNLISNYSQQIRKIGKTG